MKDYKTQYENVMNGLAESVLTIPAEELEREIKEEGYTGDRARRALFRGVLKQKFKSDANQFLERVEMRLKQHMKNEKANAMNTDTCAAYPFENCPHCGGLALRDELVGIMEA